MEILFGQARPVDVPELTSLMLHLDDTSHQSSTLVSKRIERMVASKDDGVFKAQIGTVIVGVCVFSIHHSTWYDGKIAYIHAMVVKSEYRSRGIGSRIIEYFTKAMKDSGVIGLELDSGFARERAHKFYEAEGFKKVSFLFSRRI